MMALGYPHLAQLKINAGVIFSNRSTEPKDGYLKGMLTTNFLANGLSAQITRAAIGTVLNVFNGAPRSGPHLVELHGRSLGCRSEDSAAFECRQTGNSQ